MDEMTSFERILKTVFHEEPDRVPLMLMALTICATTAGVNNVYDYATNGKVLARGQLNFQKKYGTDVLVAMSDVASVADCFGCESKFYDGYQTPVIGKHFVNDWRDWAKLKLVDPTKDGRIPPLLEACKIMKDAVGESIPVIGYAPSPITCATWIEDMAGVLKDIKRHPEELKKGLESIAESCLRIGQAFVDAGADALFMGVTRCTREILTEQQYEEFGKPYDLHVLNGLTNSGKPLMLHVCGNFPMLELLVEDYPVVGINWWDRGNGIIGLKEFKEKYGDKVTLIGGLDQTREMLSGTPAEVDAQTKDAVQQAARGGGFILCTGCELGANSPPENILAAADAIRKYGQYPIAV